MDMLIVPLFIIVFDCRVETHSFTKEKVEYCETNVVDDCSGNTIHDYQSEGHTVVDCYPDEPPPDTYEYCKCSTDMECAEKCGGNGDPEPIKE